MSTTGSLPRSLMEEYILRALVLCLFLINLSIHSFSEAVPESPKLLLTPQRLRRLQRDRERQTARWTNFENRVQTVRDSPERGFELALYFAVTHDEARGREAIEWAKVHHCERRQVALIMDWCRELGSIDLDSPGPACPIQPQSPLLVSETARNHLFMEIAEEKETPKPDRDEWRKVLAELENGGFADARCLYSASEYLEAVRSAQHTDLRLDSAQLFARLPTEFLLSMKPAELDKPSWLQHVAALALVDLDPNLEGSQFVQGWAIEDRQMLRDGPGVTYELLWADPYLPGVGYQNLDPWIYDPNGRLLARDGWDLNACWINVSSRGVEEQNCPPLWQRKPAQFGRMTLIPAVSRCFEIPRPGSTESVVLWKLKPNQVISYSEQKQHRVTAANDAGLFLVPLGVSGKVCTVP